MSTTQEIKRESAWGIGALLALGFVLFVVLLSLPVLIRAFLFQPFSIPARSMMPTLLEGDFFFVSKYPYGYLHNTSPFPPSLFDGGKFWSAPARGDVVTFLSPKDNSTVFIKRVVGLPGDRIQMKQGLLYINDVPVVRERLPDFVGEDPCGGSAGKTRRWRETLPNGVSHETLDCIDNGFYDTTSVTTVPAGRFFVLGDNRDNSTDSRVRSGFGDIPLESMIGRAAMIFFSAGHGADSGLRTERIGMFVR